MTTKEIRQLEILVVSSGLLEVGGVNARKGPLASEGTDFVTELFHLSETLLALLLLGSDTDEVLEKFAASFLLEKSGELNSTVKEVSDNLHVLFFHVTRSQGRCTETDTTRDLGGCVTRHSVL